MFDDINNLDDSITEHNTLAELYRLLKDYADIGKMNKEIKNHRDASMSQQVDFESTLSREQKTLYNNIIENDGEEMAILTKRAFIAGYKMATRLLLESMK